MSEQTTGTVECWLGLPGSGRREKLLEKIRVSFCSGTEILWLVDSLHRAQSTESLLLDTFGTTVGIEVLPAGRLPSWLLERSGEMISTLDSDTQTLLIKELLINSLPEISELPDMRSGWIRKVVEIKEELIQGTIRESEVRKSIRGSVNSWLNTGVCLNLEAVSTLRNFPGWQRKRLQRLILKACPSW